MGSSQDKFLGKVQPPKLSQTHFTEIAQQCTTNNSLMTSVLRCRSVYCVNSLRSVDTQFKRFIEFFLFGLNQQIYRNQSFFPLSCYNHFFYDCDVLPTVAEQSVKLWGLSSELFRNGLKWPRLSWWCWFDFMIRNECPLIDDDDGGSINGFRSQKRQFFFWQDLAGIWKLIVQLLHLKKSKIRKSLLKWAKRLASPIGSNRSEWLHRSQSSIYTAYGAALKSCVYWWRRTGLDWLIFSLIITLFYQSQVSTSIILASIYGEYPTMRSE